jgi:tRNA pseudouridine38-40 synthase
MGINTALPQDIAVHWAGSCIGDFHARFSAWYRRYRYIIYSHPVRPGIQQGQVSWTYRSLDTLKMHQAAQYLVGEHDFSAFIDVQANAFLHHMVRNIAGALMAVGTDDKRADWIHEILESGDRRLAGVTAPPHGLYLVDVGYPGEFGIPSAGCGPGFAVPWFSREENQSIQPTHIHRKQRN